MAIYEQLVAAMGQHRGIRAADQLCNACVTLIDVDAAAIALVFDGANSGTLGASGAFARDYDELQFTLGEGPCLDSVVRRAPVLVADLADPGEVRWPVYRPAMLAQQIRAVYALPVALAGQYVGVLDLFHGEPGVLGAKRLTGALVAAELAQAAFLDVFADDMQAAFVDPTSDAWSQLAELARDEVSTATGVLVAQLDIEPAEALVRLRAHAYATGHTATSVARDIVEHRLRLEAD